MKYLTNTSLDPYYNLAFEEYVFRNLRDDDYFFLWQNDNTIVVGKHQNTAEEINAQFVEENKINVVRRITGGGAVYHDLGNINFSIITDVKEQGLDLQLLSQPIVKALNDFGVRAEFNSRNDIAIDGKKISGNAQYVANDRVLHHGTILFDSNIQQIVSALNVQNVKIESKGIKSVRSRVTNIRPYLKNQSVQVEDFKKMLIENIFETNHPQVLELKQNELEQIRLLSVEKYRTWDWNYGQSPEYNIEKERKYDFGFVKARLQIENGIIRNAKFYGDFFAKDEIQTLEKHLVNAFFQEEDLEKRVSQIDVNQFIYGMNTKDFVKLLMY